MNKNLYTLSTDKKTKALALKKQNKIIFFFVLCLTVFSHSLTAQCWDFTCFENEELAMNADCIGTRNAGLLLVNPTLCVWGPKELTFFDPVTNQPIGDSLGIEYLDQTLTYHVLNVWSGDECYGTVTVVDRRGPDIACENINLACTENYDPVSIGAPQATDNCTSVTSLTSNDEVIDFGCGETGFEGYFAPENWNLCILGSSGDGGVDVTGAPNSISVEGADNSPVSDNCPYVTKFKIKLPTEGYVSFDWSSFGGSAFDHEDAFFTIGDTCVQLTVDGATAGSYTSWVIEPGTWISFEVTSNGNADNLTAIFENFHFFTPAIKVIHRTWTGYDIYANEGSCTQIITLERASLADVQFPLNQDGVEAPLLECGASTNPAFTEPTATGYPFLDADGDLSTTHDQSPFVGGNECLIDVFYNDVTLPDCDGNYNIARTWTVYDHCNQESVEHLQVIRVADTEAPVFTCPNDMTVSTDYTSCNATFTVPTFTATDACSNNISYSSSWVFGSGQTVYTGVTPGTHQLTLSATDACNNSKSCIVNVTVEDQVAPTVVCDAVTAAAVTSEGTSIIFAESLDDGSYDECCTYGALLFEVKLEGAPDSEYAETVLFDCNYVGAANAMVNMRVTDCNGNSNFCSVEVAVQDNEAPAVLCPQNVTVDCGTDLSDLSSFGEVAVEDNCGFSIDENISETINNCGVGTVVRSYWVTDLAGNSSSCTQIINVENMSPWNADGTQINFPLDYTINGVCEEDIHPDNLPVYYAYPTYEGLMGCEQPAWSFDDEIFYVSEPSCYYVIRTWSIMDWCANGTTYNDTQIITVNDNTAPVFVNPPTDQTLAPNNNATCTANVNITLPQVDDCDPNTEITLTGDLDNGFGLYDLGVGTYDLTYTATDGCGNSKEHSYQITVVDNVAPTALCLSGLNLDIPANEELTVFANTFNAASTDNCSAFSDLMFSYSENTEDQVWIFDCDDLGNNIAVTLFVTDEAGNQATCETSLLISDDENNCGGTPPSLFANILGSILTWQNEPISLVEVDLQNATAAPFVTDETGTYDFENMSVGNNYTVSPFKNINHLNGVTTLDAYILSDHINDIETLSNGYQMIAGDVDDSQDLAENDITQIENAILFNEDGFPENTSWRFVDATYAFPNIANPLGTAYPESTAINNLQQNISADFVGVKIGDLNGTANSFNLSEQDSEERDEDDLIFITEEQSLVAGESYTISFKTNEITDFVAYQFTLDFAPEALSIDEIVSANNPELSSAKFGQTKISEGALTSLWFNKNHVEITDDQPIFELKITALANGNLSEFLAINSRFTTALSYNKAREEYSVQLRFEEPEPELEPEPEISPNVSAYALLGNHPNPFADQTSIEFEVPETAEVNFSFYTLAGLELYSMTAVYEEGAHTLNVKKQDLRINTDAVILYRMTSGDFTDTGKMILVNE